jgi:hypothetical protein
MKYRLYIFISLLFVTQSLLISSELARSLSDGAASLVGHEAKKLAVYQNLSTGKIKVFFVQTGDFCPRYLARDPEYELQEFIFCGVAIPLSGLFERQDIFASYARLVGDKKE